MPHADNPIFFDAKEFTGEKLPPEMRESFQFICYAMEDFEIRLGSGETKVFGAKTPLSGQTGNLPKGAGSNAEKDQRQLDHVLHICKTLTSKPRRGPGFYFRKGGGITGIDLDSCVSEGVIVTEFAQKIVAMFPDTYWEISPSGTGLHGYVHGTIRKTIARNTVPGLEVYSEGRYFTISGDALSGHPAVIAEGQDRLDTLYDTYVPAKAKSKPGKSSSSKAPKGTFQWPETKIYEGHDETAPEGAAKNRDNWFHSFASSLRYHSIAPARMLELMAEENSKRCEPPLENSDLQRILDSVVKQYEPGPTATFTVTPDGLFGDYFDPEKQEEKTVRIGPPLARIEKARDANGDGWALLVEFTTEEGKLKQVLLPAKDLQSTGRLTQQNLQASGYQCPYGHQVIENRLLLEYLGSVAKLPFSRRTDQPGWDAEQRTFTTSREIIGSDERLRYEAPDLFKQAGSYDLWRSDVSEPMASNPLGVFAMCAPFTSVILPWLGLSGNPVFLLYGDSTLGKTKCLEAAASVWGDPNVENSGAYLRACKTTANGLEGLFAQANDTGAIFDDMKELNGDDVEDFIFMATNGHGKQ
jgi:Domain of unknown function (DUF927)/Primase C terminal 1 (PriCT-1)